MTKLDELVHSEPCSIVLVFCENQSLLQGPLVSVMHIVEPQSKVELHPAEYQITTFIY
jgi:hypothetical protein